MKADSADLAEEGLLEIEDIVSVCSGLIIVDKESDIIDFFHYTAREYFEQTLSFWFPDAQSTIGMVCVTYLSLDTFEAGMCLTDKEFKTRLRLYPLYDYAARNWGYHVRATSREVEPLTLDFLESEAKVAASVQAMMADSYDIQEVPRKFTGMHLAAYFGLREAIVALLERAHDPNSKDSYDRTPLLWAALNGHEAMVMLLIENSVGNQFN